MRIYRVSFRRADDDEHVGYSFFANREDAEKEIRDQRRRAREGWWDERLIADPPERFEFEPTKPGILGLLECLASHADNGGQ